MGLLPGSQKTGLLSTGALTGTLSAMQRAFPHAKPAFDIFADAVMNNSVQQQFNPVSIDRFNRKQLEAMTQIMALTTAQPATNSARQPVKNLLVSTEYGELTVHTTAPTDLPSVGDKVELFGSPAPDGLYTVSADGRKLKVRGGKITEITMPMTPTDKAKNEAYAAIRKEVAPAIEAARTEAANVDNLVSRNLAARRAANNQSNK